MNRFDNKVVVVTGGASGLGKESAKMFAKEGATVAILDIDTQAGAKAEKEIGELGAQALFVSCDLTDPVQVEPAFATVVATYERVDILHANAGKEVLAVRKTGARDGFGVPETFVKAINPKTNDTSVSLVPKPTFPEQEEVMQEILLAISNTLSGTMTAKQALDAAAANIEAIIK